MGAALAEVVGPVPHQLHRLAELLRDRGGLERGVGEQVPAEGAAALRDVNWTLVGKMPRFFAIFSCAQIGDFRLDQISALPGLTSAIAQLVSSGSPGRE